MVYHRGEVLGLEIGNDAHIHKRGAVKNNAKLGYKVLLLGVKSHHAYSVYADVALVQSSVTCKECTLLVLSHHSEGEIVGILRVVDTVKVTVKHKLLTGKRILCLLAFQRFSVCYGGFSEFFFEHLAKILHC